MKALLSTCVIPALLATLLPAQGVTLTSNHQPGGGQPTATKAETHLPPVPPPPANAIPVPMPRGVGVDLPPGFVDQLVSYDPTTNQEVAHPAGQALQGLRGRVAGMVPTGVDPEPQTDSYNNPLTRETSTSFPWGAQCRIYFKIGTSGYIGSGTLIDARHVITAGHCVHGGQGSVWATDVRVYPAWDGDSDAYGAAKGVKLYSWTGWTGSSNYSSDMGIIRLDRPVGFLTGWMGYGYDSNSLFYMSNTTHVAGYPGSQYAGAPHALYYSYGTFTLATSGILTAHVNWPYDIGGMSGSGIYYIDNGTRYVHGNLSHGPANWGSLIDYFGACRMTSSKFDSIKDTMIPAGYPATSPDFRPLNTRVTTPAGGIQAGATLTGMDYLVVNESLQNPASATYQVKVYLSTNRTISSSDTLLGSHTFTHNFGAKSSTRVTVSQPPAIPATIAAGTYYVGVILEAADYDTGNNNITGWDAAEITVLAEDRVVPTGLAHTEGGSSHNVPGSYAPCRSQSLYDASLLAGIPSGSINRISYRRNGSGSSCEEHRMTVEIHLSSNGVPDAANWDKTSFTANRGSDWTRVLSGQVVDLPATAVPAAAPAPFSLVIPLSTPFLYTTGRNLLVQLDTADDTGNGNYYWPVDAQYYSKASLGSTAIFGTGCPNGLTFSGSMNHDYHNATLSWWWYSAGGYSTPALGILGVSNQNYGVVRLPLNLAGIGAPGCSLLTDLVLTFPGATDASGTNGRYRVDLKFPLTPALANQNLFAQTLVFDGSYNNAGIRASEAIRFAFGPTPQPLPALSLYTYGVSTPFSDVPRYTANRAVVIGLGGI